jgi:osmotically-inducible protein OsmY
MTRYALQGPNAPLHILVKNGRVILEGFVGREAEKPIATMPAKRVPGVFSVKNNLHVDETVATGKPSARQTAKARHFLNVRSDAP